MKYQPVTISSDAFLFCRYGVAALLWVALIFQLPWLTGLTFGIFLISAVVGVQHAPMIWLYTKTVGRFFKKRPVSVVDVHDIRFVHRLAAAFNGLIVALYLLGFSTAAWVILIIFVLLKTISAFGYCPASKLRNCVLGGSSGCCSLTKKACGTIHV